MLLTYTGSGELFGPAFFGASGLDVSTVGTTSTTEFVLEQAETGHLTTFTGTGFTYDVDGDPDGGTITSINFADSNGGALAALTGINWTIADLSNALEQADLSNFGPMALLLSQSPLTIDASGATGGVDLSEYEEVFALVTDPIVITGSDYDDTIVGGAGNDTIDPGSNDGYDEIYGSLGTDTYDLSGASSSSYYELIYGNLTSAITASINGTLGTGTITSAGSSDTVTNIGTALTASDGGFGVTGTTLADTFNLEAGDNGFLVAVGDRGNDTFNVTLSGGTTRLDYRYGASGDPTEGLVMNLATGVVSNDGFGFTDQINITGGSGRLEIRATDHDDNIIGSDNDERFILGGGNDTLDAGGGYDEIRFNRSRVTSGVDFNMGTGVATGMWQGVAFNHMITNVERVSGSSFDDNFTGNSGNNRLEGRDGNDTLNGLDGEDRLYGGRGNDTIIGGGGADDITGDEGNDMIYGGWGYDFITAGSGNDTVWGGDGADEVYLNQGDDIFYDNGQGGVNGADTVFGGFGNDTIFGGGGDDEFRGEWGNDTIYGGTGNDQIHGGEGNDTIYAGIGNDQVWGGNGIDIVRLGEGDDVFFDNGQTGADANDQIFAGGGNDTVWGGGGEELIRGGAGNDTLYGGLGNDTMYGDNGDDTMRGGQDDDMMFGGSGNDEIYGNQGVDRIFGGTGNDTIHGGLGDDVMTGGPGDDVFVFNAGNGDDRITDFTSGEDIIRFANIAGLDYAGLSISYNGGDAVIDYGTGSITLNGIAPNSLTSADFEFIL